MPNPKIGIEITANDRTKAAFNSVNANMRSMQESISKIRNGTLIVAALGAAYLKATKSAIEFGDAIAKQADAVGLSTDALQAYRFAANRGGIETAQFDSNMTAFVKRVGEARAGIGPLTSFLQKYDTTLLENIRNTKSQEDALKLIADAIAKARTATDRAAIANAAFSRAGVKMVNILRDGRVGLDQLAQSAKASGAIMDESLTRKAEVMNDRWDTLTNTIGVKLKGALISAADASLKFFNIYSDQTERLAAIMEKEKELAELRKNSRHDVSLFGVISTTVHGDRVIQLQKEIDELREQSKEYEKLKKATEDFKNGLGAAPVLDLPSKKATRPDNSEQKAAEAAAKAHEDYVSGLQADVDALNQSLMSRTELENLYYENRQFTIEDAFQQGLLRETERKQTLEELEQQHQDILYKIQEEAKSREQRLWEANWQGKLAISSRILGDLSSLMVVHNRRAFELGKAAAVSETVVNTIRAAQGAYAALAPIPIVGPALGIAAAAAATAAGLARVSQIESQSFGGGAGISAGGGGAAVGASAPPQLTPTQTADTPTKSTTIQFLGPVYGLPDLQDTILTTVKDAINDQDVVIIGSSSRQAAELTKK